MKLKLKSLKLKISTFYFPFFTSHFSLVVRAVAPFTTKECGTATVLVIEKCVSSLVLSSFS